MDVNVWVVFDVSEPDMAMFAGVFSTEDLALRRARGLIPSPSLDVSERPYGRDQTLIQGYATDSEGRDIYYAATVTRTELDG